MCLSCGFCDFAVIILLSCFCDGVLCLEAGKYQPYRLKPGRPLLCVRVCGDYSSWDTHAPHYLTHDGKAMGRGLSWEIGFALIHRIFQRLAVGVDDGLVNFDIIQSHSNA